MVFGLGLKVLLCPQSFLQGFGRRLATCADESHRLDADLAGGLEIAADVAQDRAAVEAVRASGTAVSGRIRKWSFFRFFSPSATRSSTERTSRHCASGSAIAARATTVVASCTP